MNIIYKLILIALVISYIVGFRFNLYDEIFYFDIFLILYVLSYFLLERSLNISKSIIDTVKSLFIIFLPAIILINFTNNIHESLAFIIQYLFLIIVLPLFMESIYRTKQFDFLLKTLLFALVLNSILFITVFLGYFEALYFPEKWGIRFSLGEFTPNEMGHYLVLILFLIITVLHTKYKYLIGFISIFPYIMTSSKTVLVQLFVFLLFKKSKFTIGLLLIAILIIYFSNYSETVLESAKLIFADFGTDTSSNKIRIDMFLTAINNIPNSILFPAYHSAENIGHEYRGALSAHNGPASFITNFGLISFLLLIILSIYFIVKNIKDKYFRFVLFFIFLDLITLMFNPIINSRIVWFPLFLYIATYNFKFKKMKNE